MHTGDSKEIVFMHIPGMHIKGVSIQGYWSIIGL